MFNNLTNTIQVYKLFVIVHINPFELNAILCFNFYGIIKTKNEVKFGYFMDTIISKLLMLKLNYFN